MNPHLTPRCASLHRAFTLIELLVVISIIAVLAGLTLETVSKAKGKAKAMTARKDLGDINTAIAAYKADYGGGRFPIGFTTNADVTFGSATFGTGLSNSHPVGILLAVTNSADGVANANNPLHRYNPRKIVFLNAKQLDAAEVKKQGIGGDGTFRDPWENPYIISMDTDQDGWCMDGFYSLAAVSRKVTTTGHEGWVENNPAAPPTGTPNVFRLRTESLAWSFGPDGKADAATAANAGDNKDNITTWK